MLNYVLLFFIAFLLAILVNYLRFKVNDQVNRWIFVLSSLLLVGITGMVLGFTYSKWLFLVFIAVAVICFRIVGGLISVSLSWFILMMQSNISSSFYDFLSFLLFAFIIYFIIKQLYKSRAVSERRLAKLLDNSKQLNVFREVSYSMQQTLNLQKLLQTILTSVTAGHGLGFNRAMILLIDEEGSKLNGIMGTGPMTAEEGFATWERIAKNRYKLKELIEIKEKEKTSDSLLNERVKGLEISLAEPNFFSKTLENGSPQHIKKIDNKDETLWLFTQQFNMTELAIFPLINRGMKVGALIIDNPVNKRAITAADIDSVIPLANQAAIAIQQSNLYTKIEEMALKDGLTGLYNQRSFQSFLEKYYPKAGQAFLSLIMLDIDSFKHYNDTNGHMLGNQILVQLAKVIRDTIDEESLAFRFGGEEFVILLPEASIHQAAMKAEQLRENVAKTLFPYGEKQPNGCLTISLGVSSTESESITNAFELIDGADKALYEAKRKGKNKVIVHEGEEKHG
jgi:diguanylate cyclase (GGDEF)-like protein